MYNPSAPPSQSQSSSNNDQPNKNRSIMFTCNPDSLDSISELVKKVYATVTPRCIQFDARLRKYGTKRRKTLSYFITFPKVFIDYIFGTSFEDLDVNRFNIVFFYDKNLLKKTDRNNKEEMFILMKLTKKQKDNETV